MVIGSKLVARFESKGTGGTQLAGVVVEHVLEHVFDRM